jgi:hypothetical protein
MGLFTDWCGKNQTKDKKRAIRNRAREVACEIGGIKNRPPQAGGKRAKDVYPVYAQPSLRLALILAPTSATLAPRF